MKAGDSLQNLHRVWMRADVIAASLAINVLGLALPIAILQMYDRVIRHQSYSTLTVLAVFTLGAFALECALRILRANILSAEGGRYDHRESCRTLERLLAADIDAFRRESPGSHADRFQAIQAVRAFYCQASALIADVPFIVIFIGLVAMIAGYMALLPILLLVVFVVLGLTISKQLMYETGRRDSNDIRRHNFLVESIGGITTIKSLAAEALMLRRYERMQEEAADAFGSIARVTSQTQALAGELAQAASILTVVVGAVAVVSGVLSVGGLAATTLLTGRLLQPVLKGLGLWSRYPFIRLAEEKIRRLDDLVPQVQGQQALPRKRTASLKMGHVGFCYESAATNSIHDVSIEIPAQTYIGITGATSSGRSTLLKLLNGMLTPTEGSIQYDGVPICLYDGQELRRQIALLPTAPVIYSGTLLENLTLFERGPVLRRALALCRVLGLDDYVVSLNRGLDTQLTGTSDVPMGIAQRISLIRSLAQNPRIMLFDTANAALDHDADRKLLRFFERRKGRRSAVFVTDRPSYLKLCDVVYEMVDGRLKLRETPAQGLPVNALVRA
jgi:ATP-binding cassette subfamily C protein LapB